jgi:hypothetical protein
MSVSEKQKFVKYLKPLLIRYGFEEYKSRTNKKSLNYKKDDLIINIDKIDNNSCWKYLLFKKIGIGGQIHIKTLSKTYDISEYIKDFHKNTIYYRRKFIIDDLLNI